MKFDKPPVLRVDAEADFEAVALGGAEGRMRMGKSVVGGVVDGPVWTSPDYQIPTQVGDGLATRGYTTHHDRLRPVGYNSATGHPLTGDSAGLNDWEM